MSNYAFCFESDLNDSPGRITECFLCSVQPEYKIVKWVYILQMVHKFCYIRLMNIFRLVLRHSPVRSVFLGKMTVKREKFNKNQQNWGSKLHF